MDILHLYLSLHEAPMKQAPKRRSAIRADVTRFSQLLVARGQSFNFGTTASVSINDPVKLSPMIASEFII